jgi:uncharacterized membrane protein
MGLAPFRHPVVHLLAATPMLVTVLDAMIAAVIAILVALQLGVDAPVAVVIAGVVGVIVAAAHLRVARRSITRGRLLVDPLFPSPPD